MRFVIIYLIMLLSGPAWADSVIQRLKAEGALVLWLDFRSRSFWDFSGHGNHGTPTDVHFAGDRGVRFPASTSKITVSDSPELQLTEGTLVVFGEFLSQKEATRLISKRDAGGINYDLYFRTGPLRLILYDGTISAIATTDVTGKKYIAINMKSGEKCEGFVDGISIGLTYVASTITEDDAPLLIGGLYVNNYQLRSTLTAALIVNRRLTASEHAELYAELASMVWPSRGYIRTKGVYGPELVADGDMEDAGTGSWQSGLSGTVTKELGNVFDGNQVLRIAYNGVANPGTGQNIPVISGVTYRVSGWARGDGSAYPFMRVRNDKWEGVSSTSWQRFDFICTPNSTGPIYVYADVSSSGYTEWDNISVREVIQPEVQFATTWAAEESYSLTAGWIPNTPIKIYSGTWSVLTENVTYNGETKLCKVLKCDSAGFVHIDNSMMTGDFEEDAYGTWEWLVYHSASSMTRVGLISSKYYGIFNPGYRIDLDSTERIFFIESYVGTKFETVVNYLHENDWFKFRFTRNKSDGQFYGYVDDTLIDVTGGSGTNPVTDNTTTESKYFVLDFDGGDKIVLGCIDGSYPIHKLRGVWVP